jgi:hypothetical protein
MRYIYQVYVLAFDPTIRQTDYAMHTSYESAKAHAETILKDRMNQKVYSEQELSEIMEIDQKDVQSELNEVGDALRYTRAVTYRFGRKMTERVNVIQWVVRC